MLLSTTTTSRLRRLAGHARRVALGDFSEVPAVAGGDEVSELSAYFRDMTRALKERDEQVLAAQKAISGDEARAVQESLSGWLQQDLASRIEEIRRAVEEAPDGATSQELKENLRTLSLRAANSLQSALLFAMASRKQHRSRERRARLHPHLDGRAA
ncbi:MAG: HAMP domain-containing protein [Myxococcales bacterium]|nr:HAMP domain-containing protein [Myxococcales bacterium]